MAVFVANNPSQEIATFERKTNRSLALSVHCLVGPCRQAGPTAKVSRQERSRDSMPPTCAYPEENDSLDGGLMFVMGLLQEQKQDECLPGSSKTLGRQEVGL